MVEQYLAQEAERYSLDPLSRRDLSDLATMQPTGLHIGFDAAGLPVHLRANLLTRNMLITGETGSGKTNLMKVLIGEALSQGIHVWVFDFKNEYRDMGLPVLHWRDLPINPLSFLDERDFLLNGKLLQRVFGHSQGCGSLRRRFLEMSCSTCIMPTALIAIRRRPGRHCMTFVMRSMLDPSGREHRPFSTRTGSSIV